MTEQDKDFLLGCAMNAKDMSERIEKETKDGYVSPYYILEKADAYESFIQHHVDIAEIAIQECDNSKPIEQQRELSRCWLCNFLAADAQDFHGECWRTGHGQPLFDPYIDRVLKASKEYTRLRFGEGPVLTDKQFKRVQLSVRIIAKKTCEWLYQDYLSQIDK